MVERKQQQNLNRDIHQSSNFNTLYINKSNNSNRVNTCDNLIISITRNLLNINCNWWIRRKVNVIDRAIMFDIIIIIIGCYKNNNSNKNEMNISRGIITWTVIIVKGGTITTTTITTTNPTLCSTNITIKALIDQHTITVSNNNINNTIKNNLLLIINLHIYCPI